MQSKQAIALSTLVCVQCFLNVNRRTIVGTSQFVYRKILDDVVENFNGDAFN